MGIFRRREPVGQDFRLGDAELLHQQNPRTFFIPSRAEREAVQPGDQARLLFEIVDPAPGGPTGERMWVQVVESEAGAYVGRLDAQPAVLRSIGPGSRIEFGPEHILTLMDSWPLGELKAFVSRRSHVEDLRPRYLCREDPMNAEDSGWQLLVGDETASELDDPDSILLQPLGFVTDRWPELRPIFDSGEVGSEWVWDDSSGTYVRLPPQE